MIEFFLFLLIAAPPGTALVNGDFEALGGKDGSIPGWTLEVGARNGADEPRSSVSIDSSARHRGKASLRLSGDDTTRAWVVATQEIPARPEGLYRLRCWVKAKDVRGETVRGTQIRQFQNCHIALVILDGSGEALAREYKRPKLPTSDWQEIALEAKAPASARRITITAALTMSGTFWVDDLVLEVKGGKELAKERVFEEGFEKATAIPPSWKEELGAQNGSGPERSSIAIDLKEGAPGSPRSLKLSGDSSTIRWYGLVRTCDADPGDAFQFSAMTKAKDVRKEGIQFQNLYIRLVFLDKDENPLGAARFGEPGTGTFDWKKIEVRGVAPEGSKKMLAGIFLSMSGEAWFDRLVLDRLPGTTPPYQGWASLETKHLLIRYAPDHPRSSRMKDHARRLDEAYEDIRKRLGISFEDRITVFLYRDNAQGKSFTGRDLDFANPEGRAVHQQFESTPAHEMVHVMALKIGQAQTGLLGEGLAVYLNGAPAKAHHEKASKLLRGKRLPSLKVLLEKFPDQAEGYPAAGSFCGFIIETFGMEKFKELYPSSDPAARAPEVLGATLEDLERKWHEFLKA